MSGLKSGRNLVGEVLEQLGGSVAMPVRDGFSLNDAGCRVQGVTTQLSQMASQAFQG